MKRMSGGFLKPSAETQRKLKAKRDADEAEAKRVKKVKAAERKAVRDNEKARIAEIKKNIESGHVEKTPVVKSAIDEGIDSYLSKPPYYGRSAFESKDALKLVCDDLKFNKEKKMWGTRTIGKIQVLMATGKWFPAIPEHWGGKFVIALEAKCRSESAKAEAISAVKRNPVVEEKGPVTLNDRQRKEKLLERARNESLAPTAQETERCEELGLTPDIIAASGRFTELHITSGLSLEARLIRHIDTEGERVRQDYELQHEIFFNLPKREQLVAERVAEIIDEFRARALEMAR